MIPILKNCESKWKDKLKSVNPKPTNKEKKQLNKKLEYVTNYVMLAEAFKDEPHNLGDADKKAMVEFIKKYCGDDTAQSRGAVHPRNLPDDIMHIVEKKVSNGRESIAELKNKIDKKVVELYALRSDLVHGVRMLEFWQEVLIDSEKNGDKDVLDKAKGNIENFQKGQARGAIDSKKLKAEIAELEQQVQNEPKIRHMHRELFLNKA